MVLPVGIVSTGWPAVRDKCLDLGVRFDLWQDGLGRAILAKRADGKYAAGVGGVVISIPRQVGKTYVVGAIVFALCILYPGLTVVWTAHRARTAGETFRSMQGMAKRRKIAPFVQQVFTGTADEEIRFRNGSRVLFGARERGFGRGFAEVDIEVFDEAQILTEKALDDMVPATNQSRQPTGALLFFIGTPPRQLDPGDAFRAKRARALAGLTTDTLYVEMSADPDAKPDDRKQWATANPSYPKRTPTEAMLRMRENLSEGSFLREALGVWDEFSALDDPLPVALWRTLVAEPPTSPPSGFAVDRTPDMAWTSVAVHCEGHVDLVEHRRGAAGVVDACQQLFTVHRVPFAVDPRGPAASLIEPLRQAGVTVVETTLADLTTACSGFADDAEARLISHSANPVLDSAVENAKKRTIGDRWAWDRAEASPLVAATLARWVAHNNDSGGGWMVSLP